MEASGHFVPHETTRNKVLIQSQKCAMVYKSLKKTRERMNLSTLSPQVVFHTGNN